ncbi:MAG TPA: hypothetical protein PLR64_02350 [Candidatus Dojkabacteria bacterium]|nr:hypothetical protein [Candidatus Dojkabacteria bacterium]
MGRFERGNRGFGGGKFERRQMTMYPAVCDKCGRDCKVPFQPSGDKPVYCSNCFEKQDNGNSDRFERRDTGRRSYGDRNDRGDRRDRGNREDREMFSAVCDNCGQDCQVPFKPSSDKPIFCSKCFEEKNGSHSTNSASKSSCNCEGQTQKLDSIIEKLDRMLLVLEGKNTPKVEKEAKKVVKKEVKKKAVKKAKATKKVEVK